MYGSHLLLIEYGLYCLPAPFGICSDGSAVGKEYLIALNLRNTPLSILPALALALCGAHILAQRPGATSVEKKPPDQQSEVLRNVHAGQTNQEQEGAAHQLRREFILPEWEWNPFALEREKEKDQNLKALQSIFSAGKSSPANKKLILRNPSKTDGEPSTLRPRFDPSGSFGVLGDEASPGQRELLPQRDWKPALMPNSVWHPLDQNGFSGRASKDSSNIGNERTSNAPSGQLLAAKDLDSGSDKANLRYILWKKDPVKGFTYKAQEEDTGAGVPTRVLSEKDLDRIYKSGEVVVNSGDVPHGPKWKEFTADYTSRIVIHEETSANADRATIEEATLLGDRKFDLGNTMVFNALPQETSPDASRIERATMGNIVGTGDDWLRVNKRINDAVKGVTVRVADKKTLLDEFQNGNSSVIFIYAHFDGKRLYLPGVGGETLSVDEIARINRTKDTTVRDRVIILAACSTAAKGQSESLVQVLLNRGIARTVFATDRPYDARDIPALMQRLKVKPLRKAAGQLQQYVELERPRIFPGRSQMTLKDSEVFSGE